MSLDILLGGKLLVGLKMLIYLNVQLLHYDSWFHYICLAASQAVIYGALNQ